MKAGRLDMIYEHCVIYTPIFRLLGAIELFTLNSHVETTAPFSFLTEAADEVTWQASYATTLIPRSLLLRGVR